MGSYPNPQLSNYPPPIVSDKSSYKPPSGYEAPPAIAYGPSGSSAPLDYGPSSNYGPPSPYGLPPNSSYNPPPGLYRTPPFSENVYPSRSPIINQPMGQSGMPGNSWMNMPQTITNCPPGLEYLSTIDQLLIHQEVELLEAFTGFETANKYTIKNSLGQKVYYAIEESDCLTRNFCGPLRSFHMKIIDNYRNQVIQLHRPLACDSCWFPCCLQRIEVTSPPGTIVGTIEQEWSLCYANFAIKNPNGETVLRIVAPFCTMTICGDVEFKIMSADGSTEVGKISKQWSGLIREMFTDADYFGITFPMDLDVKMKAVMIGACFLIDAMFFEKSQNKEHGRPGML